MKLKSKVVLFVIFTVVFLSLGISVGAESQGRIERDVASIEILTMPTRTSYEAFDLFDSTGLSFLVRYSDGTNAEISADMAEYSYQSADSFRYGDRCVIAEYLGKSIEIPVEVTKASYDISGIGFSNTASVYNGLEQSIGVVGNMPIGLDGIPLEYEILGTGKNAGSYSVALVFRSASKNYEIPESIVRQLVITPYETEVVWEGLEFIYDGTGKVPSAYYVDAFGNITETESVGVGVNAGRHTALAILHDTNYKLLGASCYYEIKRASYDLSRVSWSDAEFYYDGSEKSIELLGLPEGVAVISYSIASAINAGEYEVIAKLSYDTENYNEPIISNGKIIIKKCCVAIPILDNITYTSEYISPYTEESFLYNARYEKEKSAGKYFVNFEIIDKNNYEFFGGLDAVSVSYEILPASLFISVSDVSKYLFEKESEPSYTISSGTLFDTDELKLSYYREDGLIYCVSENPNYSLTVTPGVIRHYSYPSLQGIAVIALLFLFVFLVITLFIILIIKTRNENREVRMAKAPVNAPRDEENNTPTAKIRYEIPVKMEARKQENVKENRGEKEKDSERQKRNEAGENIDTTSPVDPERADNLISDSLAKDLVRKEKGIIYTEGNKKGIINVDTISTNFLAGDSVDVNLLKEKNLIPYDTAYIKVLARGIIDKPLSVYANDFSLSAVKMIALTGGTAIKVTTAPKFRRKIDKAIEK